MVESFSGTWISLGGSKVTFPLPKGYFADVQVSEEQTQEYRDLVRRRLDAALSDEKCCNERLANGLPCLNPRDWKSTRSFDGLQVFRRRLRGRSAAELAAEEDFPQAVGAVANGQPSVIAIGNIPGSIEDVLYGFAGTTDEETRTTLSFLLRKTDAAILHNFELGTAEDPLHYFGLKWLFGARSMGSPRDACVLQAMGVEVEECGKRYGYLVLHSVDLPECPPFDHKKPHIVRGKIFFTCIFRESTPGFVDVLARGIFDMSGERRLFSMTSMVMSPCTTATFIGGLRRLADCAEVKKLTLLVRRTASRANLGDPPIQLPPSPKQAVCVVCIKRNGNILFAGTHLRRCRVCGMPICSKCQAKNKRVFLGWARPWSVVPCCPMCAMEAQRLTNLHPSEAEFAVTADFFIKRSSSSAPVAMSSFGLSLADQVARCIDASDTNDPCRSVVACPNAGNAVDVVGVEAKSDGVSFSDSRSDLDASRICPSSSSNETDGSSLEEVEDKGDSGKEDEQLPAVVDELLRNEDKIDCRKEQVADFRDPILAGFDESRERNCSEGGSRWKEIAEQLQELQSAAGQIYGDVVAQSTDK